MATGGTKRQTASERREDVLHVAIREFATYGYHGGSTERIAREAGISQPYVQRLFGTKKALFIAALSRVCDSIIAVWDWALTDRYGSGLEREGTPEERIAALRAAFQRFVSSVVEVRLVLQASAAAEDPEIRERLKTGMADMFDWVRTATGASYPDVQMFWAHGMMLMIAASIGAVDDAGQAEWARVMLMMPEQAS